MRSLAKGIALAMLSAWCAAAAQAQTKIERGRYLVEGPAACGNCHTPKGPNGPLPGKNLAGGFRIEEKPFTAWTSNITPDKETGIGTWSDAELRVAIRDGKRPDGSLIGPPMPFELYRDIADEDLDAIIAYLRIVPAVRNAVPKSEYRIPLPPAYGPPVGQVKAPPRSDQVAYGAYLAGPVAHCTECHTPMQADGRRDWRKTGAGGQPFEGPWGVSVAANITQDRERGLGAWSDAEIERAIRTGTSRDGRTLFPPMGYQHYVKINREDMTALIAYLRSLPSSRPD
jgi:mono/diheme cytochrome c family protein